MKLSLCFCCGVLKYFIAHFSLVRDAVNYTTTPYRAFLYHSSFKYFKKTWRSEVSQVKRSEMCAFMSMFSGSDV